MKKKHKFIKYIGFRGLVIAIVFGITIISIEIIKSYHNFKFQSKTMRKNYIEQKKIIVKNEVERVVKLIHYEKKYYKNIQELQPKLLKRIGKICFGENKNLFIFIVSYDGTILLVDKTQSKIVGKNMFQLSKNAAKLAQMERDAVRNPNGGFIDYNWTKPSTGKLAPKTSFMKGIKEWEWMVGAGVYLDDVEDDIAIMSNKLKQETYGRIKWFSLTIVLVVLLLFLLLNRLNKKMQKDLNLFVSFFDKAAAADEIININLIQFSEIYEMAKNVNKILLEKRKNEEELSQIEKLKSIGLLAGGIAHDFNNILAGILGNIQLAKMFMNENDEAFTTLSISEKAVGRATDLTKQLLTFAKGGDPVIGTVKLPNLIQSVAKFNLSGCNIKLHCELSDTLWEVKAEKGQISQVIANLIINAKDAMSNAGNIYIKAENFKNTDFEKLNINENYVKIIITDEGKGISKTNLENIFNPYFTTKSSGRGLGLSIVLSIIKKHNGHIEIKSQENEGSVFTIYLPANDEDNIGNIIIPKPEKKEKITKINILIMDDEDMIRLSLSSMLTLSGYNVDTVEHGEGAIQKYIEAKDKNKPFDIVVMDLTILGKMGGKDAVAELLKIDPNVKAIVMSGYSEDAVMANYLDYGFKGKLDKPLHKEDMENELNRVLST